MASRILLFVIFLDLSYMHLISIVIYWPTTAIDPLRLIESSVFTFAVVFIIPLIIQQLHIFLFGAGSENYYF